MKTDVLIFFNFQVSIQHLASFHPFFILSSILFLSHVVGTDKNILPKKPLPTIENGLKASPDAEQKQACFLRVGKTWGSFSISTASLLFWIKTQLDGFCLTAHKSIILKCFAIGCSFDSAFSFQLILGLKKRKGWQKLS